MEKRSFRAPRWLGRSGALTSVLAFLVTALGAAFAPAAEAASVRAVYPTAAEQRHCHGSGTRLVVCVDQSAQRLWVVRGRSVIFGPVTVRTGRRGQLTRTGTFRIYWRHQHHWSSLYNAPMPYAQFFSGGEALHGVYGNLGRGPGSHGCVNLTVHDAARLWPLTRTGTVVEVWGHKPGS
ncbi:L,D-transpeptidase [Streptacidiphilus melanogenes]|uniref:L,D-transpeptidase n=1 Tax=Streptacidiphilus melanogenes TaxID=411235 RepID=UPI000A015C9F|nr:L,D-transpeptidase [Streptacidiphilus melanogenes]